MKREVILKFENEKGLSFKIHSNGMWRFAKNGLSGFGLANGQLSFVDNVMGDGGEIKNVRLTRVDRTVKAVYMDRMNNAQARSEFLKFFTLRKKYKVFISYMDREFWAEGVLYKLQGSENLDDTDLMGMTMTFAFANPLWKSIDDFGKDIASIMPTCGFPWLCPLDGSVAVGVFNFEREVTLSNDGDVDVYPRVIITASGYCLNPVFKINDAQVKINDTMADGDVIVMDLGALPPRIEKNGVNYFGHADKKSEFTKMFLVIGNNTISFDAENGSDNISVTVFYNKMYTVV